ncbi:unnamed protein product [Oppiella nova]|uniref:Uncharacterized protein n=1 Tax=Oppiella nova TaxID=334625 RepID=A0A7R9ML30_9ACAR|nr:unnamed protein product [Oppiella nova]CAG2178927.1 unnamed protein product [Oppiella nova]
MCHEIGSNVTQTHSYGRQTILDVNHVSASDGYLSSPAITVCHELSAFGANYNRKNAVIGSGVL